MKPIEPGCKCLIISCESSPENVGRVVTAVKRYASGTVFACCVENERRNFYNFAPVWSVVEEIPVRSLLPPNINMKEIIDPAGINVAGIVNEKSLMRIDDGKFDDNPYKEDSPISVAITRIQNHWANHPETWDEFQKRTSSQ